MRVKYALDSIRQTTTALTVVGRDMKKAARRGVRTHLEVVGEKSQVEVPREYGELARSMVIEDREMPVPHGWIDYRAPYAIPVHEIPPPPHKSVGGRSARHDPPYGAGGKWRYLADPFAREDRNYLDRVARECAKELRRARRAKR